MKAMMLQINRWRIEAAYLEYLRAKYRRKIRRGEIIDLDGLAREIRSVKEERK